MLNKTHGDTSAQLTVYDIVLEKVYIYSVDIFAIKK